MSTRSFSSRTVLVLTVATLAASLAGCVPASEPSPTPTASAAPSPSATQTPTPTETVPPETAVAITIPCSQLVSAQTMYDFNPNFGLLASFTPDSGTLAARALADKGIACRWVNQTSGDTVDVSLSHPAPSDLAAAMDAAETGTPVAGLGDSAFFSKSGSAGVVQVFRGEFMVTVRSVFFSTAADASSILADAIAAAR